MRDQARFQEEMERRKNMEEQLRAEASMAQKGQPIAEGDLAQEVDRLQKVEQRQRQEIDRYKCWCMKVQHIIYSLSSTTIPKLRGIPPNACSVLLAYMYEGRVTEVSSLENYIGMHTFVHMHIRLAEKIYVSLFPLLFQYFNIAFLFLVTLKNWEDPGSKDIQLYKSIPKCGMTTTPSQDKGEYIYMYSTIDLQNPCKLVKP